MPLDLALLRERVQAVRLEHGAQHRFSIEQDELLWLLDTIDELRGDLKSATASYRKACDLLRRAAVGMTAPPDPAMAARVAALEPDSLLGQIFDFLNEPLNVGGGS